MENLVGTNSKSNNSTLARELTRAGYLHESRNSNCLQPRSTSSTFRHRRVTGTTNRRTEKIRLRDGEKNDLPDKIARAGLDDSIPCPSLSLREEVYMREIGSASRSASTDKITARRKKGKLAHGHSEFGTYFSKAEKNYTRVRKNQMDNEVENCVNVRSTRRCIFLRKWIILKIALKVTCLGIIFSAVCGKLLKKYRFFLSTLIPETYL